MARGERKCQTTFNQRTKDDVGVLVKVAKQMSPFTGVVVSKNVRMLYA